MTPEQIRAFLTKQYAKGIQDIRNPPDRFREGQFKAGWRNYIKGQSYHSKTMLRITWNNLGYRLAKHLHAGNETLLEKTLQAALAE